jgi:hypothetical protein
MENRKTACIITCILFLVIGIGQFSVLYAKKSILTIINEKAEYIENIITTEAVDSVLVSEGVNVENIHAAINDIKGLFPEEIPLRNSIIEIIVKHSYKSLLDNLLKEIDSNVKIIDTFQNQNGKITIHSIINGLKQVLYIYLNRLVLIIQCVLLLVAGIYIVFCVVMSRSNKRLYNNSILFGEDADKVTPGME